MLDLAAHANALERRRLDYSTLADSLSFPRPLESEVSVLAYEEFLPDQPDRMLPLQDSNAIVRSLCPNQLMIVLARRSQLSH
jgi:hypothetical protein